MSTEEKLGAEAEVPLEPDIPPLVPPAAAPPLEDDAPDDPPDIPDEPLEPDPDAAGEDEDLSLLVLDEELCAAAMPDSANSAAAVAALTNFSFNIG